jgi:flagellar M-ring protein FliF
MAVSIKDRASEFAQARWADFKGFTPGQKAVTVAAVVALAVGAYLMATWKTSPSYAPLYTNLAPADASAIVDKLNSSGVSYKLGQGGTEILVPQSKVYSTRLTISAAGLPNSGESGYSLLDKEGVTTSQFKQQVDYQRAIEGELARTIQSINGVQAASVHLAIPQQDVFNDGTSKASAAVLLTVAPGTQLTNAQVQSVVYLVSSSVPQMAAADVTVTDSNGTVLKAPGDNVAGGADSQAQMTQAYDNRIAASLQAMLDRAIGAGHAVITVNSTLDFNKTSTTQKQYVYNKNNPPVSQSKTTEVYNGTGTNPGGTLGTGGTGTSTSTSSTGNGKYSKVSDTVDNALGTVTSTTENAPGAVKNLSVAVMLDSSVKNLNVGAISNLIKSGVGYTPSRGDQLSVQAVPFDNTASNAAAAAAKKAAKDAAAKASQAKLISLAKQGGLALLVLIALFWVWRGGRKRRQAPPEPNDDLFGLDDDLPPSATEASETATAPAPPEPVHNPNLRKSVVSVADNRPKDVARVLADWLEAKEK